MERSESGARSLRGRESDGGEFRGPVGPQLDPVALPSGAIGRIPALRDHALEAELPHRAEHLLAPLLDVLDEAERPGAAGGKQSPQRR